MLFVLIVLCTIAAILWASEPGSAVNRRLAALAFSGGSGALAAMIDLHWLPQAAEAGAGERFLRFLYELQALSSLFSYYGIPYLFLLFALAYRNPPLKPAVRKLAPWLLLAPIVLCVWLTPYYNEMYPISYKVVVWWAVPYILTGTLLVLSKRVPPAAYARTHWIVSFAVLPPVLFSMFMNYVLPSLGMLRMWRYNTWIVGLGAIVFVIGLFTYGFLGVRVLIDRKRYDTTLRAVTSGTAMLHHAIKNDAGKLKLFAEKMKRYAQDTGQTELLADAEAVLSASRHMEEMVYRVHRRTEDLVLRPERCLLGALVEETARDLKPLLQKTELTVDAADGWSCELDKAQVKEALHNIMANAVEAMKGTGKLTVSLQEQKRELIVEIRDSGPGIPANRMKRIFEPFYTTKGGGSFGLGLPYAYHVMRKHKGSLTVRSKDGEGTVFYMIFPKRHVAAKRLAPAGESAADAGVTGA